jgi:hypothetical protein
MTCLGRHRGVEEELELIRKLSGRMRWVVSTTPRPLYRRQTPSTHYSLYKRQGEVWGPIWKGSRKVRPPPPLPRIRFPDRPARKWTTLSGPPTTSSSNEKNRGSLGHYRQRRGRSLISVWSTSGLRYRSVKLLCGLSFLATVSVKITIAVRDFRLPSRL